MPVHVYGIIDGDALAGLHPAGHEAGALSLVPGDGIAAVVSPAGTAAIEPSVAHVWHHETVLAALMERHAVLPMRFGTICRTADLSSFLGRRSDALRAGLALVRGRVEMAVRIVPDARLGAAGCRPAAEPVSGKSYLLALAARQGHLPGAAGAALRDIRAGLDRLSFRTVWQGTAVEGGPFKASCLVARDAVAAFADGLQEIDRPELRLSCTGPWAPYSFVEAGSALEWTT